MTRIFILLFLWIGVVFANNPSVEKFAWPDGVSLLQFMETAGIPASVYYDLDKEDQELAAEVRAGVECQILRDPAGRVSQLLIPVSEELQIHIYRDKFGTFRFVYTPIVYEENSYSLGIQIESSPYQDIIKATGNAALANEFMLVFKNEVNFKKLQKGDRLVILYEQKTRLGKPFGGVNITAGMIEENKKPKSLYFFDDKYYDRSGKKVESFLLITPLVYTRISSYFTPKRFHPILKRYRAHLGVDYAAPKGTRVNAAGAGKISFVGRKNGYGNTVEINHGLSSGPHLHFGLYKNKQAIDPLKVVKIEKTNVISAEELKFKALVKDMDARMAAAKDGSKNPAKFENYESLITIN